MGQSDTLFFRGPAPSKPLGEDGTAYPSGAGVPACAHGAAAADVGKRVFSRVRDANMNEKSYIYVAAPHLLPVVAAPALLAAPRRALESIALAILHT